MAYKFLDLHEENKVWLVTLQRPEALNALNAGLLSELDSVLTEMHAKPFSQARALILTGAGEKSFVAGGDIKEMSTLKPDGALRFAQMGQLIFQKFEKLKIPTLAAVNGFALGGGLELALSCDFIFAAENAKLGLPEVTLGLLPGFGGTVRLARVVGMARAKEMIFTGELLTASQACEVGLVNRVVPLVDLMSSARKTAETMASRGPLAIAAAKRSVQGAWDLDIDAAMKWEAENFSQLFASLDMIEGTSAFVEKRKANFKGE